MNAKGRWAMNCAECGRPRQVGERGERGWYEGADGKWRCPPCTGANADRLFQKLVDDATCWQS